MSSISPNVIIQVSNDPPDAYFQYTLSALVVYEHTITLNQEILYTWRYRMTATTIILLVNRYLLLGLAIVMAVDAGIPSTTCSKVNCIQNLPERYYDEVTGFSATRILAISAWKAWILASIAFSFGMVPAAITMYLAVLLGKSSVERSEQLYFMPEVCIAIGAVSSNSLGMTLLDLRICAIISDLLVIITTWVQAIRVNGISGITFRCSLLTLFLRDGTAYFLVLVTANITQLLAGYSIGENSYRTDMPYLCWLFATSILTSRFIFNLRQFADGSDAGTNLGYSSTMSINSSTQPRLKSNADAAAGSIMGNIGASLDHGFPDPDESGFDGEYGDDD